MISKANELVLRDRLLRSGGAAVFPIEDVPRNAAGEFVIAGWFAVDHSAEADPLILDRRPESRGEARQMA